MSILIRSTEDTVTFQLPTTFNCQCQAEFRQAYEKFSHQDLKSLVLNFRQTEYIDSASLGMILVLRDFIRNKLNIKENIIEIEGGSEYIQQIFKMVRFEDLFYVRP